MEMRTSSTTASHVAFGLGFAVITLSLTGCGGSSSAGDESNSAPNAGAGSGGANANGGSGGSVSIGGAAGSSHAGTSGASGRAGASGGAGSAGKGGANVGAGAGGSTGGTASGGHVGTAGSGGIASGGQVGAAGSGGESSGGQVGTGGVAGSTTAGGAGGSVGAAGGPAGPGRGFPATGPWASFYGTAQGLNLSQVASTFRVVNLDADPDGDIQPSDIQAMQNGGQNRVISYLNVGSCENFRSYWDTVPSGFVSCSDNTAAQRGPYDGYPDETWMDVGNPDYQKLIVQYVAPRLIAQGVDGFFLDNLEIVEHAANASDGPCDAACSQGGLDLVRMLREAFPNHLIVMQNGTSDVTRLGKTGGLDYPSLLDGVSHEEVYAPTYDSDAEAEMLAWKGLHLTPGGQSFFLGTEDYVGSCSATSAAKAVYDQSKAQGFSPYESDASDQMTTICFWSFL